MSQGIYRLVHDLRPGAQETHGERRGSPFRLHPLFQVLEGEFEVGDGLHHFGAKRIAVANSYYRDDWRDGINRYLTEAGFEVVP